MGTWTLAELAALAARALGDTRGGDARVTGVPDPRLIRWYTTIGLLDRPTIGAGHLARYGMRHLLQVVAVKRLQAQGLPLAQIQARLAGATDAQLAAVAAIPDGLTAGATGGNEDTVSAERTGGDEGTVSAERTGRDEGTVSAERTGRDEDTVSAERTGPGEERFWARRPAPARASGVDGGGDTVTRAYGLHLPGGVTLLLPHEAAPQVLDDIAAAARPLLDLLAAHGLLNPPGSPR